MQQLYIDFVKQGMCLGKNVYDENGNVLLRRGVQISDRMIQILKNKGFQSLCIDNEETKDIQLDDNIPVEVRQKAVDSLKNLDLPSIMDSAKKIVECLCEKMNISFDLMDIRDRENFDYGHAVTVAEMSVAVAKELRNSRNERLYNNEQLESLAVAALLHDIGKRCSNHDVLKKLNIPAEAKESFMHYKEELSPVYGYNLLKDNLLVSPYVKAAILFHKADENGKNMPLAIEPNKVHPFAKIIHVTDTYDMLINQLQKEGIHFSNSDAIEYLMANCHTKFNTDIVKTFIKYIPIYPKGTYVNLSNGQTGIVYENKTGAMLRPVVLLKDGTLLNLIENNSITIVSTGMSNERSMKNA